MQIDLVTDEDSPGRSYRAILVDGNLWGFVQQSHRGMHGIQYFFEDSGREVIPEKRGVPVSYRERYSLQGHAYVWSDKQWLRGLGYYGSLASWHAKQDGKWKPLEDRLIEEITKAITDKRLMSPAALVKKTEAERLENSRRLKEITERRRDLFLQHARQVIDDHLEKRSSQSPNLEKLAEDIAVAMEWAREQ